MNHAYKFFVIFQLLKKYWKSIVIIFTPLLLLPLAVQGNKPMQCAYVIIIVAIFWITEVMNLAVTSLIPIVLFSAFGMLTPAVISSCYMKDTTLMLIGGMVVARTIEKQNLHKRLALRILKIMGPNPVFQYMGFMLSTWLLSMWISNAATSAMMITLANAVVDQKETSAKLRGDKNRNNIIEESTETVQIEVSEGTKTLDDKEDLSNLEMENIKVFSKGLYLSIAYSATCGGMATLPGTGSNLVFYGFMEERYGSTMNLHFGTYLLFGLPISIIVILIAWMVLCIKYLGIRSVFKRKIDVSKDKNTMKLIEEELDGLGSTSFGERSTLAVFFILVLLWVLREPGIPLWGRLFTYKNSKGKEIRYWSDAISAILGALLVFNLPAHNPFTSDSDEKLMSWQYLEKGFPWGLIFLFGGGFALAAGSETSGLSYAIGGVLSKLNNLSHFSIILIASFCISFLTEITSNTATVTLLLPIMLRMAECINMHPMKIGLTVAFAGSFSFCLPAATLPNAIIFSTGKVRVIDMVTSGVLLNIVAVLVFSVMVYYYTVPLFHTNVFPIGLKTNCSTT